MKKKSITNPTVSSQYSSLTTYQAGVLQSMVHRSLQKYTDLLLKPYGITKTHWLIIGTVLDSGDKGIRVSDLANKIDTTMAYLTNTINLLESKKILVRTLNGADNRAKFVTVHGDFIPKCDEIEATVRKGLRKLVYSNIEVDDFQIYMTVLQQLSVIDQLTLK